MSAFRGKQTWRLSASCHFCFSSFALRSSISRNRLPIGLLGSLRRMGPHFLSNSRLASASGPVPYIKRSSSSKSVLGSFLIWSFLLVARRLRRSVVLPRLVISGQKLGCYGPRARLE